MQRIKAVKRVECSMSIFLKDDNILELYLQISPIFLAIVVKYFRYTVLVRCLLRTEPQHEQYIFDNNSTLNGSTESLRLLWYQLDSCLTSSNARYINCFGGDRRSREREVSDRRPCLARQVCNGNKNFSPDGAKKNLSY
jgi:hypothetical protein